MTDVESGAASGTPHGSSHEAAAEAILQAALAHVPFDGWTMAALKRGAVEAGFDADMATLAFPGGAAEAIALWSELCDRRMAATADWHDRKVRARVAAAVRLRLETLGHEREAVRRGLTFLARPGMAALATKLVYRTVDEIWYRCGDTATDFNFYTKRALLAGVYTSTLMCWLDDMTEGHAETWAFLDRRIDDALRLGSLPARMKQGRPGGRPPLFDPARFARRVAERLREGARG